MPVRSAPLALCACLALALTALAVAEPPPAATLAITELAERAADLALGEPLRLTGVRSTAEGREVVLEVARLEVFPPDAIVVVMSDAGEQRLGPPANVYLGGRIEGEPGSRVLLTLLEGGEIRGLALRDGEVEMVGGDDRPARVGDALELVRVTTAAMERATAAHGFACDADLLEPADLLAEPAAPAAGALGVALPDQPLAANRTARVAVDTDFEFYQKFNNTSRAVNYIGDLIGYASLVYAAETNTSLNAHYVRIWTTSNDPWTQTSPLCNLYQFGKHWNDNMGATSRTIAHMMSGKSNGGGVAWAGVLCSGAFNYDSTSGNCTFSGVGNYGGGYGYTGGMNANFSPNNPSIIWDLVATTHEIGHNFNSPHTHCYAGLGGNASHIDHCWGTQPGCYAGTVSLPGPGSVTGGVSGQRNGTIMSYCHQRTGGFTNIAFTFGVGHLYGVAPERVPARMAAHVNTIATNNPACLALAPQVYIFADGFESGNTSRWALGTT